MGLISSPGVGSGLDVNSIITAILNAEAAPVNRRLQQQEAKTSATLSGLGSFKSALNDLKSALGKLDSESDFNVRKVSTSSSDYLSATATNSSSVASYAIEVVALAVGAKRESGIIAGGSTATFATGQLTLTAGTKSFVVDIDAADSLSAIRTKINAASGNFGVTASIITTDAGTKLTYASSVTGLANALQVTNNNAALDAISTNTVQTQAAADGQIKIDGQLSTSSTNTYAAISDLTITAIKKNVATETTTVTISNDAGAIKSSIQKLVDAYNTTLKGLRTLGQSSPGNNGILAGDSGVRTAEARLRQLLSTEFTAGTAPFNSLTGLGVTTNRDGSLTLNSSTISDALNKDLDGVKRFFTDSSNGFSAATNALIDGYVSSNGILKSREDGLNTELTRISKQREAFGLRLASMEKRLRMQYAALDAIVSKFQGTGAFLSRSLNTSTSNS